MVQISDNNILKSTVHHPEGEIKVSDINIREEECFPLDVLPNRARMLIEGGAGPLGLHPDYFAAGILFAVSTAIGNTHVIQIKNGKTEHALLFSVVIGNPNSNKSFGLNFPLRSIISRDDESYLKYKEELKAYKKDPENKERDCPTYTKILVQDYTRESLAQVHSHNLRGIAVFKDEISGWVKDFNRYGGGGEEAMWLSIWTGSPITVDRVTAEPIRINNPYIPVGGTIQPGLLKELSNGSKSQNGFIDRLLFVWPEVEKPIWIEEELPKGLLEDYLSAIDKLFELDFFEGTDLGKDWESDKYIPNVVKLSSDARTKLFHYFNKVNKPKCDKTEEELLAGIHGKFDIHVSRLALILQLLWYAYGEGGKDFVSSETVDRAIKLGEYFRSNAIKVYNRLHKTTEVDKLPKNKQKLYNALPDNFKRAEGINQAKQFGIAERTFCDFITDGKLFCKEGFGKYSKIL